MLGSSSLDPCVAISCGATNNRNNVVCDTSSPCVVINFRESSPEHILTPYNYGNCNSKFSVSINGKIHKIEGFGGQKKETHFTGESTDKLEFIACDFGTTKPGNNNEITILEFISCDLGSLYATNNNEKSFTPEIIACDFGTTKPENNGTKRVNVSKMRLVNNQQCFFPKINSGISNCNVVISVSGGSSYCNDLSPNILQRKIK